MMSSLDPYIGAIKGLALLAISLGVFWFGHRTGSDAVQAKWNAAELTRANAEKSAVLDRVAQNQQVFRQQEISNDKITKAHDDEINKVRIAIASAPRLRPGAALCGGFAASAEAKSAGGSNAADTGVGLVRPDAGRDIDALKLRVEEAMATGRACQSFVRENGLL